MTCVPVAQGISIDRTDTCGELRGRDSRSFVSADIFLARISYASYYAYDVPMRGMMDLYICS